MNEDVAESRFQCLWDTFVKEIKKNERLTLSQMCRRTHTHASSMSSWMRRRGYSVSQLKDEIRREAMRKEIHQAEKSLPSPCPSSGFVSFVPPESPTGQVSLSGIQITFNSGTTVSIKRATPEGLIEFIHHYERKDGATCTL